MRKKAPVAASRFIDDLPSKSQIFEYWKQRLPELVSLSIGANQDAEPADFIVATNTTSEGRTWPGANFALLEIVSLFSVATSLRDPLAASLCRGGSHNAHPDHQKENAVTVTTLDPKTALIVVDLQMRDVPLPTVHPMDDVVKRVRALTEAFRGHGLPVVLVNVAGVTPRPREQPLRQFLAGWTGLIPELNQQPRDQVVTKHTPGAFTNADLEPHLRSLGVMQVVISGVATSNGVEVTARQIYELGFKVTLATDAMTDLHADAHTYSITRIFPKIGETGTTQEIIDVLKRST
jgi:nicotinamidase-related amidase